MAAPDKSADLVAVRLGEGLRRAREMAGVSKAELARRLTTPDSSVPPNYVYRWEVGERRLEYETIERAEQAMDVQPGTVFRLAGFVSDGGLLDLGSLHPEAQRSIRAIIREYEAVNGDSAD